MKNTLCLQLYMDVVWVHSFSLQKGRVREQVCCCHTAGVEQIVGCSVCSTGGFVKDQRTDLRPGNIHRYLKKGIFSEQNLIATSTVHSCEWLS